ncbi:MAG: hypothetical protein DME97_09095 [Verrucomicrobia bacterium]|nr:MAG: hypothetical protein DME97_09095 [Verrucomicrobiota bacterium]
MHITREEEIAVLYALHCHGGTASKSQVVELILRNKLLQPRVDDEEIVATGERRIVNRIAWLRQNLKQKGDLMMPRRGVWQSTPAGRRRLFRLAERLHNDADDDLGILDQEFFERLTPNFLARLRALAPQAPQI